MGIGRKHIHLDFHNHPSIPDVGAEFDPERFAHTIKATGAEAVNVFGKCTHGMSYYPTEIGLQHPGLNGRDLLGEMIEALHKVGLRAPVYYCVGWEERLSRLRPEWMQIRHNGVAATTLSETEEMLPDEPGTWHYMDFNNPDYYDHIRRELLEIVGRYPVDGWWLDILHYHPEAGYSDFNVQFRRRHGILEYTTANQRRFEAMAKERFAAAIQRDIITHSPGASVFFNANHPAYVETEANPKRMLAHATQWEIESLATGLWGYHHFPRMARLAVHWDKPWFCMTGRFYRMWGDFGGVKPQAALEYELFRSQALGGGVSIGDQLHPSGRLGNMEYNLIRSALRKFDQAEPLYAEATPLLSVGILYAGSLHHTAKTLKRASLTEEGALLLMDELRYQAAMVDDDTPLDSFDLLVIPEQSRLSPELVSKIEAYYRKGGKLLITGNGGFDPDEKWGLQFLPLRVVGEEWDYPSYAVPEEKIGSLEPETPIVMYLRGQEAEITDPSSTVLARRVPPYFRRTDAHYSSHYQAPPSPRAGDTPAVARGEGWAYISYPIFQTYREYGYWAHAELTSHAIGSLGVEPPVTDNLSPGAKVLLSRKNRELVVTILNYSLERKATRMDTITHALPFDGRRLTIGGSLRDNRSAYSGVATVHTDNGTEERPVREGTIHLPDGEGRAILVLPDYW